MHAGINGVLLSIQTLIVMMVYSLLLIATYDVLAIERRIYLLV